MALIDEPLAVATLHEPVAADVTAVKPRLRGAPPVAGPTLRCGGATR